MVHRLTYLDLGPAVLLRTSDDEIPPYLWIAGDSFVPLHVTPMPCRSSANVIRRVFCGLPVDISRLPVSSLCQSFLLETFVDSFIPVATGHTYRAVCSRSTGPFLTGLQSHQLREDRGCVSQHRIAVQKFVNFYF